MDNTYTHPHTTSTHRYTQGCISCCGKLLIMLKESGFLGGREGRERGGLKGIIFHSLEPCNVAVEYLWGDIRCKPHRGTSGKVTRVAARGHAEELGPDTLSVCRSVADPFSTNDTVLSESCWVIPHAPTPPPSEEQKLLANPGDGWLITIQLCLFGYQIHLCCERDLFLFKFKWVSSF